MLLKRECLNSVFLSRGEAAFCFCGAAGGGEIKILAKNIRTLVLHSHEVMLAF